MPERLRHRQAGEGKDRRLADLPVFIFVLGQLAQTLSRHVPRGLPEPEDRLFSGLLPDILIPRDPEHFRPWHDAVGQGYREDSLAAGAGPGPAGQGEEVISRFADRDHAQVGGRCRILPQPASDRDSKPGDLAVAQGQPDPNRPIITELLVIVVVVAIPVVSAPAGLDIIVAVATDILP